MHVRTLLAGMLSFLAGSRAVAADHVDSPGVVADPATDLADLYAWMSPDGRKVELALAISAGVFAPGIQYVFHTESAEAYGEEGVETLVICTFDSDQNVTCWVGDEERVRGNARRETGLSSDTGRVRVFTGLREDAFYFNAAGFSATIDRVKTAAPALSFDPAGCPELDPGTASALAGGLATDPFGGEAEDLFVGPVAVLLLEIDTALLTKGGPIVSLWASTRR